MHALRRSALLLPLAAFLLAACGPGGGSGSESPTPSSSPTPSGGPTPTPIGSPVASVDEAAAVVIASDARFSGVTKYDPNLIGANAWWEGEATTDGFAIKITIGWGDCPAGCIYRHVWNYTVTPGGDLTLVSESGDPLGSGGPSA